MLSHDTINALRDKAIPNHSPLIGSRAAFQDGRWSRMDPAARKRVMHRWADIANDSDLGRARAVWSSKLLTAHIATKRITAGLMQANTYGGSDVTVPMAGMKQSGNGADKSLHAIDKYPDLKTVWMKL